MKQLGNLAMVCAQRSEVLMTVFNGSVTVCLGNGPDRKILTAPWNDDEKINRLIYELNFGAYAEKRSA